MRLLFKVLGSPVVGMGHVMRSLELAGELQERDVTVVGFFCNSDTYSQEKIESEGFECISVGGFGDASPVVEDLIQIIDSEGVDVIIVDHPGDLSRLCSTLKAFAPELFIVALDNFDLDNDKIDVIINLYNHAPDLKSPTSESVRYYEGVQYGIIRSAFDTYICKERNIRSQVKNILVSFGGSDPRHNTLVVMDALSDGFPLQASCHLVLGSNFGHNDVVKQRASQLDLKVHLYEGVANIEELMYYCDLGLCGAGTTMMEMACLGTPTIVLVQSEEEARFAEYFEQHGVVRNLGLSDGMSAERVRQAIIELAGDQVARRDMCIAGKSLVDGRGRERIAELVLRDYEFFRSRYG